MTLNAGDCQLYTGTVVSLAMPTIEQIHLDDIIHSLSLQCRFNGHCRQFYSVAEHSLHVEQWYRRRSENRVMWGSSTGDRLEFEKECMYALLHDAPEAYTGDIITPIKTQPGFAELRNVSKDIMDLIASKFNLGNEPNELKAADQSILKLEYSKLCKPALPGNEWPELKHVPCPQGISISCLWPVEAEAEFSKKVHSGLHRIEDLRWGCNRLSG